MGLELMRAPRWLVATGCVVGLLAAGTVWGFAQTGGTDVACHIDDQNVLSCPLPPPSTATVTTTETQTTTATVTATETQTVPGPTTTVPGPTTTVPGPTTTVPGPTITVPGPTTSVTVTATPTPPPTPTSTAPPAVFPNATNTGVPAGTALTAYTGSCTITAANTVINAKTLNCDLVVHAANLTVTKSKINGQVWLDQDLAGSSSWSMSLTDTEVNGGNRDVPAVCCGMYTLLRVNAHGGHNGAQCENGNRWCSITDSFLHGPYQPASGDTHLGGFLSDGSDNITLRHNTVWCDAAVNSSGGGCTGDINLIPNFAPVNGALIDSNLLGANVGSSFCTYGGEKSTSPFPHSNHVVYQNNVFQRGTNGICAAYGPVNAFDINQPGNQWVNNRYDNGAAVNPAN